jgi:hypothetical protein
MTSKAIEELTAKFLRACDGGAKASSGASSD